jgi:predicted lactoylglutathione lyase
VPLGLVLHVKDIAAASRFYQSLGFKQTAAYPRSDGELTVALFNYGPCAILLGRKDELHYDTRCGRGKFCRAPMVSDW